MIGGVLKVLKFSKSKIITSLFFAFLSISLMSGKHVKAASPTESFVTRLYETSMGREPDTAGLNYWTNILLSKKQSGADVAKQFIISPEFSNKNLPDNQYVSTLYTTLMDRTADDSGQAYWSGLLQTGYSRLNILAQYVNTPEFKNLCSKYGIVSGNINLTDPIDTRPDIVYFVTRFYNQTLGRAPEPDGLKYHVNQLAANKTNAAQLSETFVFSQEFLNRNVNSTDYMTILYKCFFDRDPDGDGLNYWLNKLAEGYSRRYVLASFVNSQEFLNISKKYNIYRGEMATTQNDVPLNGVIYGFARWDDYYKYTTSLNLKDQPSSSGNVITTIPKGSKVIILQKANDYYKVRYVSTQNKLYEGYVGINIPGLINGVVLAVTDDSSNSMLGVLSGKYESSGNPGSISTGVGDVVGGKSYGAWQFSANQGTVNSFMKWLSTENPTIYATLDNARQADAGSYGANFDNAWTTISSTQYDLFYSLQQKYTKVSYYDPVVKKLMNSGSFDSMLNSFAIRNVIWSTAVQFGPTGAFNILSKFMNLTDKSQFIDAVYNEKLRLDVYFASCPTLWDGLTSRFTHENADAQFMRSYELQNGIK